MKLVRRFASTVLLKAKMRLAERGVIVLAEPIDNEKNIYKVYCLKCKTWYAVFLSGLPGKRTLPPTMRRSTMLLIFIALFI